MEEATKQLATVVAELAVVKQEAQTERQLRAEAEKALEQAHQHEEALAQAKHQAATQLAVRAEPLSRHEPALPL